MLACHWPRRSVTVQVADVNWGLGIKQKPQLAERTHITCFEPSFSSLRLPRLRPLWPFVLAAAGDRSAGIAHRNRLAAKGRFLPPNGGIRGRLGCFGRAPTTHRRMLAYPVPAALL